MTKDSPGFELVRWGQVPEGAVVARCALCDEPAKVLDHLAPYHQEYNRCAECAKL